MSIDEVPKGRISMAIDKAPKRPNLHGSDKAPKGRNLLSNGKAVGIWRKASKNPEGVQLPFKPKLLPS